MFLRGLNENLKKCTKKNDENELRNGEEILSLLLVIKTKNNIPCW